MVFDGNTSSTAVSDVFDISGDIQSFSLANKSGGAITASVAIFFGSAITYILFEEDIADGENYIYLGGPIRIVKGYQLLVSASGSCDYYFSIK